MAIRWKVKVGSPEHTLAILAAVLVFFCIELLIEQWLFDNDFVVDLLGATTGALSILLLRFAIVNSRLYRELRDNSEKLERRVSEIAHEFQTPITILRGNLPLLSGVERLDVLATSTATLDRLSRLVRTLLDVAKLNAPNRSLSRETLDVEALAWEICEDCALLAEDRGITISFRAVDRATGKNSTAIANHDQLKEVLLNLIGNALKYTASGGAISVEVGHARGGIGSGFVEISVADTGCGIARENLPHIFERFYRIADTDGDSDATISGNGLGLYLSKQIVEAHGGTLGVESEVGRGSRFIVHLPAADG